MTFYLEDIHAEAVVVGASLDTPARDVARARGISVIELHVDTAAPAGAFTLDGVSPEPPLADPSPDDVALVLHTSGTTSRPKLVPLTHRQLGVSARNVAQTLQLSPADRCLNVMPLFHIHGLVAALLASLDAGASVACCPGFHQLRFFDWLDELEPTWYTAVPTMHAAVVARARDHQADGRRPSTALRPVVVGGPPRTRARRARADLRGAGDRGLRDDRGRPSDGLEPAAARTCGRRGPSVAPPARRSPSSTHPVSPSRPARSGRSQSAARTSSPATRRTPRRTRPPSSNGWFRTGDEGFLDDDGFLTLRGRIKEVINRGGEKISPMEVDDVLLRHAAVAQAVTFAMPDPRLGEEVAAAVVLAPDQQTDERTLQDFVVATLAPFKVPRRIVLVDEIPKGPTGKVQRIGLAERLGVEPVEIGGNDHPPSHLESELIRIWESVLGITGVGVNDDFFALGGDSILGAEAVARVRDVVGDPNLPLVSIVRAPTPAAMAHEAFAGLGIGTLGSDPAAGVGEPDAVVPRPRRATATCSRSRSSPGGSDRSSPATAYAFPVSTTGRRSRRRSSSWQPTTSPTSGACNRTGRTSSGATASEAGIAVEMARQLEAAGEEVAMLVLLDPRFAARGGLRIRMWVARRKARTALRSVRDRQLLEAIGRQIPRTRSDSRVPDRLARLRDAHTTRPFGFPTAVVFSEEVVEEWAKGWYPPWFFDRMITNATSWKTVGSLHERLLLPPAVDAVAAEIRAALDQVADSRVAA